MIQRFARAVASSLASFFAEKKSRAVGLAFFLDSLIFGSWVAHIPFVKEKLGLDDGQLGLALFAMPVGLLAMNPFCALVLKKIGASGAAFWSLVGLAGAICFPISVPTTGLLMLGLFAVGACLSLANVAVNTLATAIENAEKRSIMASCHGMWSFGGLVGSASAAALTGMGWSPKMHILAVAATVAAAMFFLKKDLFRVKMSKKETQNGEKSQKASSFIWPTPALWLMIFVGSIASICEGTAFDWSGVFLRDVSKAPLEISALGFAFFASTMAAARFTGDVVIPRIGEKRALLFSAALSAAGLFWMVALPATATAAVGLMMLGAGTAWFAPVLFNASARIEGLAPGAGLATFSTFSFLGFLAGPPVIGFVSRSFGLPTAFLGVGVLAVFSIFLVRRMRL